MLSPDPSLVLQFERAGGLDFEAERFEAVSSEGTTGSELHVWRQSACLVVPRAYARWDGIEAAVKAVTALGWPVFFRASGGSCVFHGSNVLCMTQLFCEPRGTAGLDETYHRFTSHLIATAHAFGISGVQVGTAPDAPCDGRFNLLVEGRKLAGTAMRRRARAGMETTLVHACLWLSGPLAPALHAVETFEALLGIGKPYPPAACISLAEAAKRPWDPPGNLAMDWARAMTDLVGTTYSTDA